MTEPTVADQLEWEAIPEETRERYKRIMRDELHAEIRRELEWEMEDEAADGEDNLRAALNEAEAALESIIDEAEGVLDAVKAALL